MQKEVKMQDIADRLGISVVAVSKALAEKAASARLCVQRSAAQPRN